MAVNPDKFQVLLIGLEKGEKVSLEIIRQSINAKKVYFLGRQVLNDKIQKFDHSNKDIGKRKC